MILITGSVPIVALLAEFQTRRMKVYVLVFAFSNMCSQLRRSVYQLRSCIGNYQVVFGDVADSGRVEAERACGDVVSVDAIMAGVWRYSHEQHFVSRYACWVIVVCDESVGKVKEGSTAKTRGRA